MNARHQEKRICAEVKRMQASLWLSGKDSRLPAAMPYLRAALGTSITQIYTAIRNGRGSA